MVSEIYRGYPSLGDVVIIENEVSKTIYAGAFTPAVVKGDTVVEGEVIARGARRGGVNVTRFPKR